MIFHRNSPFFSGMPKTKTKKRKISPVEEQVFTAFSTFEEELTFDTFVVLCEILRKTGEWQIRDTLSDVGHKIPVPELKKILEFIEGQEERYCQDIELSIDPIFESHNWSGSWKVVAGKQ
jgi:hypothetical protein